jgi:hypothetical protein
LTALHSAKVINTSIKPDNIVVQDSGAWKIVDFDYLYDFTDPSRGIAAMRDLTFTAPEVLERSIPSPATDVFSLARVVLYLFKDGNLPSPFELTSAEVIDRLNCDLQLKRVLIKATCPNPNDRYQSSAKFMSDLRTALSDGGSQSNLGTLLLDENEKLFSILRNTFWGTLAAMLLTRPLMVLIGTFNTSNLPFGLIQLSDRPIVGAFHGIIGGFVWGTLIPGVFLLYWSSRLRNSRFSRLWSVALCCFAGFLGGLICTLGAVLVTNASSLATLGWLPKTPQSLANHIGTLERLKVTIRCTRLFFAFPFAGSLTGIAAGLFLDIKLKYLLKKQLPGLTPIPSKIYAKRTGVLFSATTFVGTPFLHSLILLIPLAGALYAPLFRGFGVNHSPEAMRCFGEGLVHMFGLIGLSIGFFFGILPPPDKESRWNRYMARIRRASLSFSRRERTEEFRQTLDESH